jgi:hypoxanthine phosphoribosyltransferase
MARQDYFGGQKNCKLVFTSEEIQNNIKLMSHRIENDFMESTNHNIDVTFLILLKGAARFAFDLMNNYKYGSYYYDFIGVESYSDKELTVGNVKFYLYRKLCPELIDGHYVVILDDICNSGQTLKFVEYKLLQDFKPKVLKIATLIWREGSKVIPNFYAFKVKKNDFYFGYGLGIGQNCRHLSGIYSSAR